jgi:hypothetical protein
MLKAKGRLNDRGPAVHRPRNSFHRSILARNAGMLATFGLGVVQGVVISVLRRLHRGLLAMTVLSLVFALCPCLLCTPTTTEDCCASGEPSIRGMCCANDSGSRTVVPAAAGPSIASALTPAQPMAIDAAAPVPVFVHQIPTRPVVARAVLRI